MLTLKRCLPKIERNWILEISLLWLIHAQPKLHSTFGICVLSWYYFMIMKYMCDMVNWVDALPVRYGQHTRKKFCSWHGIFSEYIEDSSFEILWALMWIYKARYSRWRYGKFMFKKEIGMMIMTYIWWLIVLHMCCTECFRMSTASKGVYTARNRTYDIVYRT